MLFSKKSLSEVPFLRHTLFHLRLPAGGVQQFLRVQPGEGTLLAWVTAIQVVMSISSILVNNVAQTTFLKRYGADALPVVFMIEALITFVFAGFVSILMERFRKIRVFTGLLIFYGISMGIIRILISLGVELAYPALYIIKSQAVGILPILYWDILNDMFTTQQSKRLYTLISAGGILGITIGSFMSQRLAVWIGMDNILLLFIGGMVISAVLNELTEKVVGTPLQTRIEQNRAKPAQNNMKVFKDFLRQTKESPLLKYMILLIAIPNMILPLLDFQFNVIVDEHFASEALTLQFFGIFRGISNAVMFVLLLVSSRAISKWGIPVSLLFHPINYCIAFGAILLRFDLISGLYARISTELLKTVLNNPARGVLYNFFPEKSRSMIRLVLRGGVVRLSDFAGSCLLLLITGVIEPRMISLVAISLALIWVVTSFRLKKAYPDILIQSLKKNQKDWKKLEDDQIKFLAKDKDTIQFFQKGLAVQSNATAVLSAEIIAKSRPDLLAESLLPVIAEKSVEVQKKWLDLFTLDNIGTYLPILYELAGSSTMDALPFWLEALNRIDPKESGRFMEHYFSHPDYRVRAEAFTGSCLSCNLENQDEYRRRIDEWLNGDDFHVRLALKVLSKTGDIFYESKLVDIFCNAREPDLKIWSLEGLARMNYKEILSFVIQASSNESSRVRMASLKAISLVDPKVPAEMIIEFLTDFDDLIRSEAFKQLSNRGRQITPALLKSLARHSSGLQEQIINLIKQIGVPHADLSRFILDQLKKACHYLSCMNTIQMNTHGRAMGLFKRCLSDKHGEIIEIILRVLGIIEFSDRMHVILQAIQTGKRKDIDNAIEALESALHNDLRYALIPHLEDKSFLDRLSASCRAMGIESVFFTSFDQIFNLMIHEDEDPWIKSLCLYTAGETKDFKIDSSIIADLVENPEPIISEAAAWMQTHVEKPETEDTSIQPSELVYKTICLGNNPFFKELKTKELMAVARSCRLTDFAPGMIIIHEKTKAMGIYIHCSGQMTLDLCSMTECHDQIEAAILSKGLAGEMQWIDDQDQLYTIRAETACCMLEISGEKFSRLLDEYPGLALTLCRIYSQRIRKYQHVISNKKI